MFEMNLILTPEAVEWFFNREYGDYSPFADMEKALKICNMRLEGETLQSIGTRVGLCKDRVRQYIYRVQRTYERTRKERKIQL